MTSLSINHCPVFYIQQTCTSDQGMNTQAQRSEADKCTSTVFSLNWPNAVTNVSNAHDMLWM